VLSRPDLVPATRTTTIQLNKNTGRKTPSPLSLSSLAKFNPITCTRAESVEPFPKIVNAIPFSFRIINQLVHKLIEIVA
jgi:hypothetical protein